MKEFDPLVAKLGLTGNWLQVTRDALISTDQRLHVGCYFLGWDRNAIIWAESIGTRSNEMAWWISAHRLWTPEDDDGVGDRWKSSFRSMDVYPSRSALLQECGFAQGSPPSTWWEGPFALMELIPTEWPR